MHNFSFTSLNKEKGVFLKEIFLKTVGRFINLFKLISWDEKNLKSFSAIILFYNNEMELVTDELSSLTNFCKEQIKKLLLLFVLFIFININLP